MADNETYEPRHVMVIDTNRCVGCWSCAVACKEINNEPLGFFWNRVLTTAPNQSTSAKAPASDNMDVPWGEYPNCELAYLPVACQHCNDAPCVKVCPVQATFRRDDGTVLIDYNRCIGCRYCMAACPYGSRSFNWLDPRPQISHINPDFPTRSKGVVEKCNFCEERLAQNLSPACAEACPEKALVFGNLADPNSAPRQLLRQRFAVQRQPELGTGPSIYYLV